MAICSRCGNKWKMSESNTCPICKEKWVKEREKLYNEHSRNKESASIYNSTRWRRLRKEILMRDLFACAKCGCVVTVKKRDYAIDHIIPLTKNGDAYDKNNLQVLCTSCHNEKRKYE